MLVILVVISARPMLHSLSGRRELLMFASLQQFVNPDVPSKVNSVTWSLTPEVHFYILLPLIVLVLRRMGWGKILVISLIASVAWRLLIFPSGGVAEWFFGRVDQFTAGMSAAWLVAEHMSGRSGKTVAVLTARRAWLVPAGVLIAAVLVQGSSFGVPQPYWFEVALHPVVGVCVAALIVRSLCLGRNRLLESRVLGFFGLISYSLYLWHWPFIYQSVRRGWGGFTLLPGIALLVFGAVAVSTASYLLIERPAMGLKARVRAWLSSRGSVGTVPTSG
jgi:peptidoglycan/LPS O-acetylase OafA/YrhL